MKEKNSFFFFLQLVISINLLRLRDKFYPVFYSIKWAIFRRFHEMAKWVAQFIEWAKSCLFHELVFKNTITMTENSGNLEIASQNLLTNTIFYVFPSRSRNRDVVFGCGVFGLSISYESVFLPVRRDA